MKKLICILALLALMVPFALGEDLFGDLDGLVITGEGASEGLEVTVKSSSISATDEAQYALVTVYATIDNQSSASYTLAEQVSAQISWKDTYTFDGQAKFSRDVSKTLVPVDAEFTFRLPYVAAGADDLKLTITAAGKDNESVIAADNAAAYREMLMTGFDYASRHSDALDVKFDGVQILDSYNGNTDDAYRWISLSFTAFNWGAESAKTENELGFMLTYQNKYGFRGELALDAQELPSLTGAQGTVVFEVPEIVADAQDEELAIIVAIRGKQWTEVFGVEAAEIIENATYAVPDPALVTGAEGVLRSTEFAYNDGVYAAYQYAKPADTDGFILEYTKLLKQNGLKSELTAEERVPLIIATDPDGLKALIFYDYSGSMLVLIENGMKYWGNAEIEDAAAPEDAAADSFAAGDTVVFGAYEQDGDTSNGKEPIEWEVLGVENDGTCLLISKYGLDVLPYYTSRKDVTWETSTLRAWLNGEFYDAAFSAEEKERLVLTNNENADNPVYGTKGGNDTNDYVFLLSLEEIEKYYSIDKNTGYYYWDGEERLIKLPTEYAKARGANITLENGACWWWLRSPGAVSVSAASVYLDSSVYTIGLYVDITGDSVVPCIRARLF